uniref:HAT C-terminal dimerisation domain-containing protein n=1 Tax=Latimeria chalumnae TaxID=7897 RepID=H2ZYA5_LATCH
LYIIRSSHALWDNYLPKVYKMHETQLHELFQGASSILLADESTDSEDRYILDILFIPAFEDKKISSLIDVVFLKEVNSVKVSQAVVQTVSKYNVDFDQVSAFLTDNAMYMTKAWTQSLNGLFANAVHITCNAHIISLACKLWHKKLQDVNRFVTAWKHIFQHAPARKTWYKEYLKAINFYSEAFAPVPVLTRWNLWFETVLYHSERIHLYERFIEAEEELTTPTNALNELSETLQNENLKKQFEFVAAHAKSLMSAIKGFESSKPSIHQTFNTVSDLISWAERKAQNENLSTDTHLNILFKSVLFDTAQKLKGYYEKRGPRFTQPGVEFFKSVRFFDPCQVVTLRFDQGYLAARIPCFSKEEYNEFLSYSSAATETNHDVDAATYWFLQKERWPALAKLAIRCLSILPHSEDAERSLSRYGQVVTNLTKSLKKDTLLAHTVLVTQSQI